MDIRISFPMGQRVDAAFDGHVVHTDQPTDKGGDNTAPSPFDLFLTSLGTCAGSYVLNFCRARDIPTDDIELVQRDTTDGKRLATVEIEIRLPASFPEKYLQPIQRAAEGCRVKRTMGAAPTIEVVVKRIEEPHLEICS